MRLAIAAATAKAEVSDQRPLGEQRPDHAHDHDGGQGEEEDVLERVHRGHCGGPRLSPEQDGKVGARCQADERCPTPMFGHSVTPQPR